MARFKIHGREKVKEDVGQYNLDAWKLDLEDASGVRTEAETLKKKGNEPPAVGEFVDGTITPSDYGPKFKADAPPREGRAGRSPEETAAIQRQHSQSAAIAYLQVKATAGQLPEDLQVEQIRTLIDWFDDDIARGVERKNGNGS